MTNTGSAGQAAMWDGGSPSGVQTGYWGWTAGSGDFKADGSVAMTGPLNFGGQKGTNMADGASYKDAATWGQTTNLATVVSNSVQSKIDAATNSIDAAFLAAAGGVVTNDPAFLAAVTNILIVEDTSNYYSQVEHVGTIGIKTNYSGGSADGGATGLVYDVATWYDTTNRIQHARTNDFGGGGGATLDTTYWITNTVAVTNTVDFSVTGLAANKITLHDVRMFLSLTNGSPTTKRATVGLFRSSNRRCDRMVYLDTNQLYYSVLTTVAGGQNEFSNVVADASGTVINDLYYKAINETETNDYQRAASATASAIIWADSNQWSSGAGTLISHVNQFGGFPYYDADGSSSMWFRLTMNSGYTGTVRTVINYGR